MKIASPFLLIVSKFWNIFFYFSKIMEIFQEITWVNTQLPEVFLQICLAKRTKVQPFLLLLYVHMMALCRSALYQGVLLFCSSTQFKMLSTGLFPGPSSLLSITKMFEQTFGTFVSLNIQRCWCILTRGRLAGNQKHFDQLSQVSWIFFF